MTFVTKEPLSFLSIRLTNVGRRMLSLGKLNFSSAVLSDREIDYRFAAEEDYDHSCNRVLLTKDAAPGLDFMNFDGTSPLSLMGNVYSDKKVITASTISYGIFSAFNETNRIGTFSGYVFDQSFNLGSGATTTAQLNGDDLVLSSLGGLPQKGIVAMTGLRTRFGGATTNAVGDTSEPSVVLWYRYSAVTSQFFRTDRDVPWHDNSNARNVSLLFLPWSGADTYYGTGEMSASPVWNLNIVRTSTEIGTPPNQLRYTQYGSIEYAGAKRSFGFEMDTRAVGFVHYSNHGTGNTYGEQFIPKATIVDLPLIMWHRYKEPPGQARIKGVRFSDADSAIYYDPIAHTPYTLLKEDVLFGGSQVVGRVYFKLKIIALTDPELLTALSYKSNRNWTLPPLNVSLVQDPKPPLTNQSASGMCESGKTFYVTYRTISDQPISSTSFGYAPVMHCNYIQKISGFTDQNGLSYYLSAKFPALSFPYLRPSNEFVSFTGYGWTCNKVQLLVAKVDSTQDMGPGYIPTDSWRAISNTTVGGNGVLSGSSYSNAVDPLELIGHNFIVSNEDYLSGSTYDLTQHYSGFTSNVDYRDPHYQLGLTYGNETLFPGVIRTTIAATAFKTTWKVVAPSSEFNSSLNTTFDGTVNGATYITEIGIFDDQEQLVGWAKPTWPIRKDQGRHLTFELEFDF